MPDNHPRDFIGYGPTPPHPRWPGEARIALNFVINYEEGSEYSIADGDSHSDTALTEFSAFGASVKGRDLAAESMFEYGSRVGFWRILRAFQQRGLATTIFGCALALERNPLACEAIVQAGYDVCCHGWRWINHYDLSEDEERSHIQRAVASLSRSIGERPYGWYCRYGPSVNTRRLLIEEGGFLYDSDAYNDELPYSVETDSSESHLVVPYTLSNNDAKYGFGTLGTSEDFFSYLKDSFDVLYREGATQPKMMSVGLHMRLVGHPARIVGLERFLDYVMTHEQVWVCRRLDIARHWREHHQS